MLDRGKKILAFARAMESTFSSGEWTEIGYITGTDEWIDRHPRLLRSLSWGDSDYKGHVFDAVAQILDKDEQNTAQLFQYQPIADWLKENDPGAYSQLAEEVGDSSSLHIEANLTTESGFAALADAQALLRTRGPSSAVDRVHTGLHAFLKEACKNATIEVPTEPTANQLLKLLLRNHPNLDDLGPRGDDIKRMISASAAIVDAMGTLRNKVSLAHPNEEILGDEEALFAINLTRSLLRFLDAKLSGPVQ